MTVTRVETVNGTGILTGTESEKFRTKFLKRQFARLPRICSIPPVFMWIRRFSAKKFSLGTLCRSAPGRDSTPNRGSINFSSTAIPGLGSGLGCCNPNQNPNPKLNPNQKFNIFLWWKKVHDLVRHLEEFFASGVFLGASTVPRCLENVVKKF